MSDNLILKQKLGQGAYGEVFKAYDPKFGDIAVKRLNKKEIFSRQSLDAIYSERNTLCELTKDKLSEYVVMLYACSQDSKYLYIEMELVIGVNLAQKIIRTGYLTGSQTRHYVAQIISGIDFIHQLGVVHRDLKPDNIMVTYQNRIKITDFGLARKLLPGQYFYQCCGTSGYMAPEIYNNKGYEYSVDWYALGIIIYQMRIGILSINLLDYYWNGNWNLNLNRTINYYLNRGILKSNTVRVIIGLTNHNVSDRKEYARTIHQRSFFKGIDWNHID